jgi:hypothetical protein
VIDTGVVGTATIVVNRFEESDRWLQITTYLRCFQCTNFVRDELSRHADFAFTGLLRRVIIRRHQVIADFLRRIEWVKQRVQFLFLMNTLIVVSFIWACTVEVGAHSIATTGIAAQSAARLCCVRAVSSAVSFIQHTQCVWRVLVAIIADYEMTSMRHRLLVHFQHFSVSGLFIFDRVTDSFPSQKQMVHNSV